MYFADGTISLFDNSLSTHKCSAKASLVEYTDGDKICIEGQSVKSSSVSYVSFLPVYKITLNDIPFTNNLKMTSFALADSPVK